MRPLIDAPTQHGDLVLESFPVGPLACNCSVIYSKKTLKAFIIDPGHDFQMLSTFILQKNLQVEFLLHTHAHFDHIGSSTELKEKWHSEIWLHPGDLQLYQNLPLQGQMFGFRFTSPAPIDHELSNNEEIFWNNKSFKLLTLHTPGHTEGSCCFFTTFFPTPILFSGDTLFHRSIGRTDLPGGDTQKIYDSIKTKIFSLPEETIVITGHGEYTTIKEEKIMNPFVGVNQRTY